MRRPTLSQVLTVFCCIALLLTVASFANTSSAKSLCGNGKLESGEKCDDGNTVNGDGCSKACKIESGWKCSGAPSTCRKSCGDGVIDPGEKCDLGSNNGYFGLCDYDCMYLHGGEGCTTKCQVEKGYHCDRPVVGQRVGCYKLCGDGRLEKGEKCDLGTDLNTGITKNGTGQGCTATCQVQKWWFCLKGGHVCQKNPRACGDGIVDPGEQCDAGSANGQPGSGCSTSCLEI